MSRRKLTGNNNEKLSGDISENNARKVIIENVDGASPAKMIKLDGNNLDTSSALTKSENPNDVKSENPADALSENSVDVKLESPSGINDRNAEPGNSNSFADRYLFNFWGPVGEEANPDNRIVLNIADLHKGKYEKEFLRIRITYRGEVKDTSIGKVVSFLGMDNTGEIAIVGYGRKGIDLYGNWQVNQVYSIKCFKCTEENQYYPSGSGNKLQINANKDFIFEDVDSQVVIDPMTFNFVPIREIRGFNISIRVDLVGILLKDGGVVPNSNNVPMRDLSVTDRNKDIILVTLWGAMAENFKSKERFPIIVRKGVVGSYNDMKKINCTTGTLVMIDSQIEEAISVFQWFKENIK